MKDSIVVDGIVDEEWTSYFQYDINQLWWGEAPRDGLDLSGKFRVFTTPSNLYLLIEVLDDKPYTHPIPHNTFDLPLWESDDYDKINIELASEGLIYRYGLNYSSDSVFGVGQQCPGIFYRERDTATGYTFEVKISREQVMLGKELEIKVFLFDNDMLFQSEGLDVFSDRESMVGYSNTFALIDLD